MIGIASFPVQSTTFYEASMNFPYQAMLAETVTFHGHHNDLGEAYYAHPLGPGPFPGVVIIHHIEMPDTPRHS
jgi:hypothetical protein